MFIHLLTLNLREENLAEKCIASTIHSARNIALVTNKKVNNIVSHQNADIASAPKGFALAALDMMRTRISMNDLQGLTGSR